MADRRLWLIVMLVVGFCLGQTARADKYWVGTGTGNWSDSANWSDTAGGSGGAGAPGVGDNVSISHSDHVNRDIVLDASISIGTLSLAALQSDATIVIHHPGGIDLQTSLTKFGRYYGQTRYEQSGGTHTTGLLDLAPAQDRATYALSAGTLSADVLRIGYYGYGTFLHSGGTVNAGTFQLARGTIFSGGGTYLLNGSGASLIVAGDEQISYRSHGYFSQSAGNHVVQGTLYVGATGGGYGTYEMSGGSLAVGGTLAVGTGYSDGTFTQSGGTVIVGTPASPGHLNVGLYHGGLGYYELNSPTATLIVTGNERISTFKQTQGHHAAAGTIALAQYDMSGGSFHIGGSQVESGTFNQSGGSVVASSPMRFKGLDYYLSDGEFSALSLDLYYHSHFVHSGGTLKLTSLTFNGYSTFTIAHDSGKTLRVGSFSMDNTYRNTLDLTNNNMIVDYDTSPNVLPSDVRTYLAGDYLKSSTADPAHRLGYADNANPLLQKSTFSGETFPAGDFSQLLIMYTFGGDANLDGRVNLIDLAALATHWQSADAFWTEGDFNYDGVVNAADLGILAASWQAGQSNLASAVQEAGLPVSAIPEPVSLWLLLPVAAAIRRGRGHHND